MNTLPLFILVTLSFMQVPNCFDTACHAAKQLPLAHGALLPRTASSIRHRRRRPSVTQKSKRNNKSKSCKSIFDETNKKGRFSRCVKREKRPFFWSRRLERGPEAQTPAIGSLPPAHAQGARAPLLGLLGAVLLHGGDNALDNPPGDDGDGNHDDDDLHDVREALDLLRHGLPRIAGIEAQRAQHGIPHQ